MAGLPFDAAELESRVVWILGSPGTGSTWLLEQLCDPLRLDEPRAPGFRLSPGRAERLDALPVNGFRIATHIAPALGDPVDTPDGLLPATLNNYLAHKPAYLFARDFEDVWRPALRRLVLVRLHGVQAAAAEARLPLAGSPSLVVREVHGSYAADLLMSLFPRSRLLFLVRDGRDVIDPSVHPMRRGGWLAEHDAESASVTREERLEWTRMASREWACGIDASRRAYAAHAPDLRCMVRYEDLIADTPSTLATVFDWLGLERTGERVGRVVADHATSAMAARENRPAAMSGPSRGDLTPAELTAAEEVMGSRLAALGYTV